MINYRDKMTHAEILKIVICEINNSCSYLFQKIAMQFVLIGLALIYLGLTGYDLFQSLLGNGDMDYFVFRLFSNIFQSLNLMLMAFGWLYVLAIPMIVFVYTNFLYWNNRQEVPLNLNKTKVSVIGVIFGITTLIACGGLCGGLIVMMESLSNR